MTATMSGDSEGEPLTASELKVLIALLQGKSKAEAARVAGVHPQAIAKMLRRARFRAALLRGQTLLCGNATAELAAQASEALNVVRLVMKTAELPTRLRAATYVLNRLVGLAMQNTTIDEALTGDVDEAEAQQSAPAKQMPGSLAPALKQLKKDEEG